MLTTSSFGLSSVIPVGDTLRQTGTYCSCKRLWSMKIYLSICIKLDIALFFISGLSEVAARDKWKMELNSKSVRKEKSDSIVEYRKSMKHSCNCSKVNVLEFFCVCLKMLSCKDQVLANDLQGRDVGLVGGLIYKQS